MKETPSNQYDLLRRKNAWQIDGDLLETIFTTVIMCVYKCMYIDLSVMRKFTKGGRSDGNLLNGNFRDN